MADTLLAILLVTSAKDKNVIFHWPPEPSTSPRLTRPRPFKDVGCSHIDNFWLATRIHSHGKLSPLNINSNDTNVDRGDPQEDGWEYEWVRPNAFRQRSQSFHNPSSRPSSGRNSPVLDRASFDVDADRHFIEKEYGSLLGYPTEFLAGMLCPQSTLCHQKFEWIVDDLAFIGHPVCADIDGQWRFKTEPAWIRGRNTRNSNRHRSQDFEPEPPISEIEVEPQSPDALSLSISSALQQFHLVLLLDVPDPLSTSSKNISKYIHVIYEQIAFMFTALLYQEQVSNQFMEKESDGLSMLRESCISKGEKFSEFVSKALESSQLARSIKMVYESVVSQTIARILINDSAIELQLPPYLPSLLLGSSNITISQDNEDSEFVASGREPSYNWRLPQLKPWKSILLTDVEVEKEQLIMTLSKPGLSPEDQDIYESIIQFLQSTTVFESLVEIADSLGWDVEKKVFPIVRWLVYHQKARVVDRVHEGLKTVFVLSDKFQHSKITELTSEFSNDFPSTAIPTLPQLFSRLSAQSIDTTSEFGNNINNKFRMQQHFFAMLVRNKASIPVYRDIVTWMLKRELIVALHLRIRIVASRELKMRVIEKYGFGNGRRMSGDDKEAEGEFSKGKFERSSNDKEGDRMTGGSGLSSLFSEQSRGWDSQPRHRRRRRSSSHSYKSSIISSMILEKKDVGLGSVSSRSRNESDEKFRDSDDDEVYKDGNGDVAYDVMSSIITCPAQASRKEKLWIDAMSEKMEVRIIKKFERTYKYFDGIKTSDEILYRAGISRRDLREVLHCYNEFLITFLHP